METSTRYFNDYDIYESKSCFFRQDVEACEQKDIKLEQPFFTEESFKPDEPEPIVKSLEEFIFFYSSSMYESKNPQAHPQAQLQFERQVFSPRKPLHREYSNEYTSRSFLEMKASMYSGYYSRQESASMYRRGVKELNY